MKQTKQEIFDKIKEYYEKNVKNRISNSIPVSGKVYDEKELISAVDAVLDCWWTEGNYAKKFTKEFCNFLDIKHCILVNSGSSANLLALKCLTSKKLKEKALQIDDEIITVAAGFPTTINPIIQCGCVPVFCDVDLETYNININDLKKAITSKTKAIILAHTLGNPFNLTEIKKICEEHNLWLIEDTCDALGSKYDNKYVGTFGDLSTFSFYPAHHITMGEGGAICTNNSELFRIIRSIRDWGRDCWCNTGEDNSCGRRYSWKLGDLPEGYDHKYIYSEIGYNLKNTDINIAIGYEQLKKLPKFIEQRKTNFNLLKQGLSEFSDDLILPKALEKAEPSWFGFPITIKPESKINREELLQFLNKNKIGTRLLFGGNIIKQPYFIDNKIEYKCISELKNTNIVMNNTFWIGTYPGLIKENINKIIDSFREFL